MGAISTYNNYFKCASQKGVVLSGKKAEMVFDYNPETVGTHESYWIFEIASEKIQLYFLIVGSVIEPNVIFDVGKVNFGPLLLSGKNKELVKLKNLEDVPIAFSFEKESIKGESEYGDSLQVNPISGVIKPLSDLPIEILFAPKNEQQYNYNLVCNVKRKSRPITLNVKGIGYILRHQVLIN